MSPHLHLCLQSGSDKVLLRMRRMYDFSRFKSIIYRVKSKHPDFNFTTDLIVGFPGETEEDFQESVAAVSNLGFSHVHTFKYSVRKGTRSERMDGQVPEKVKTRRSACIRQVSEENRERYLSAFLGKEQTVLIEAVDARGWATGYGEHFVPIRFKGRNLQKNTFHKVNIFKLEGKGDKLRLIAEPII